MPSGSVKEQDGVTAGVTYIRRVASASLPRVATSRSTAAV